MNPNMWHNCYSPSARDSSFSVSTCNSPSLSMQSEGSPIAGMHMLQSPDLFQSHLSGNAINHSKSFDSSKAVMNAHAQPLFIPTEDILCHALDLDVSRSIDTRFESSSLKDEEKLVQSPVDSRKWLSDRDWPSDGSESWASASSQELLWNDPGPPATNEMPRLTPDTSPVLHTGIRQDKNRRVQDISHQESRAWDIPNQEIRHTRERHTYSQCHGGTNRSRCRSSFQPITHDDEGCNHAPRTTTALAFPSDIRADIMHGIMSRKCAINCDVNVLTRLQENDAEAGRAHQPSMSRVESVADSFTSVSASTGNSTFAGSVSCNKIQLRKTKCSAPVGDTFPSSFIHGHFRLVEQDGSPCFSFSVQGSDEVFFARACKPESGFNEDNCNGCHYAFNCRREDKAKRGGKCWFRKEKLASTLVAKMKVSAARLINGKHIDSNRSIEETHFVLYTERHQLSAAEREATKDQEPAQRSVMLLSKAVLCGHRNSMIQKERVYKELLAVAITMSIKLKHKDARKHNHESSWKDRAGWDAACVNKGSQKGWGLELLSKSSKNGYRPKAPVIQPEKVRQQQLSELSEVMSGTHLGKLEDSRDVVKSHSAYTSPIVNDGGLRCHNLIGSKRKELKMAVDVVVLLPAGCHGLSGDEDGNCAGPTPLLECWRSDGNCDCGGWDMGCGMSVLRAETLRLHKRSTIALTNRDRINWILPGRPLVIFSQGYKRRKLFMIDIIEAGLFSLSFQAQFSPLQAFATAVAIFHQQMTLE